MAKLPEVSRRSASYRRPMAETISRSGSHPAAPRAALCAALASIAALALLGAGLSVRVLQHGAGPSPFAVGESVPTSFGVVAVEGVQELGAADVRDAAAHGADTGVLADQVQVSVTLTNLTAN